MLPFLLGTRLGRSLILSVGLAAACGIGWWILSSHYYHQGIAAQQARDAAATAALQAKLDQAQQTGAQQASALATERLRNQGLLHDFTSQISLAACRPDPKQLRDLNALFQQAEGRSN